MAAFGDLVSYVNAGPSGASGPTAGGGATQSYYSVPRWTGPQGFTAGVSVVRQSAWPAYGNERIWVCVTGGTGGTGGTNTEPNWGTGSFNRGSIVMDGKSGLNGTGGVYWQEATGIAALNGDITNTITWAQLKAVSTPNQGTVIKANDGSSIQICTAAGTLGAAQPAFSATPGTCVADGSSQWCSLGAPSQWTAWQTPHARLGNATTTNWWPFGLTGPNNAISTVAGNGKVFVSDQHREMADGQTVTVTPISTLGAMAYILAVPAGVAPPVALSSLPSLSGSGATGWGPIVSGQKSSGASISFSTGSLYIYGINFQIGDGTNFGALSVAMTQGQVIYERCIFTNFCTTANLVGVILNNGQSCNATYINCHFGSGNPTNPVSLGIGRFTFITANGFTGGTGSAGILAPGATKPTGGLFTQNSANSFASVVWDGIDFSGIAGPFWDYSVAAQGVHGLLKNCKLPTGTTGFFLTSPPQHPETIFQAVSADAIATTDTMYRSDYFGYESSNFTVTRQGGGVTPDNVAQSRAILMGPTGINQTGATGPTGPNANYNYLRPFKMTPMTIWNGTTGKDVTVTVHGIWTGGTYPMNDDIWMEVDYFGITGGPQGYVTSTTKKNLFATNTGCSGDTGAVWNGTAGGGWYPFLLQATLGTGGGIPQPQFGGNIEVRIRTVKPATVFYIDPMIVLS